MFWITHLTSQVGEECFAGLTAFTLVKSKLRARLLTNRRQADQALKCINFNKYLSAKVKNTKVLL